ncbi:MAG: Gfo/Idh/MocA family oxidoreductase [SAR202 cluster bacterium]|nr:Gfo/Idh/MocA family oxidoreductase [SAR202 cluster bacterium]|tara:strand:+ start:463 stop:1533 length:1071 start_codon:yes stop_codon:yes gene_type:complete
MNEDVIKIGIVGAGGNTKLRHIPGLKEQDNVEIVSVCNSTRASSEKVAEEFGIPNVYDNWIDLVRSSDSNAICVGTYPNLHSAITIEALNAGKHVLTEARMATNAKEARNMLMAATSHPGLVSQIVPAPMTLPVDKTIQKVISEGSLGDLIYLEMNVNTGSFPERESKLHWRQNRDLSGYNIMQMGIWYEAMMRWIGPAKTVMAMAKVVVKDRKDNDDVTRAIDIPDHVDILCDMAIGCQAHMKVTSVIGLAPKTEVWIYGSEGTMKLSQSTSSTVDRGNLGVYVGYKGSDGLTEIPIDLSDQGYWRVEEEFINAIRGIEKVTHTSFADGVKYMDFTEAVTRSFRSGKSVDLPLLI